jgi:hypothetical protein
MFAEADVSRNQGFLHVGRTCRPKPGCTLSTYRPTLVAISFNGEVHIRILRKESSIALDRILLVGTYIHLLKKVDIFDVLCEQFVIARS